VRVSRASRSCSRGSSAIGSSIPARSIARSLTAKTRGIDWSNASACGEIARDLDIRFEFIGDKNHVYVGGEDVTAAIRTPDVSQGASQVSAHPEVRAGLLDLQRRLGAGGGVVVEGRDTGTVVFPRADAKFFLTASEQERAKRRVAELGAKADYETTLREIRERDQRDASRDVAPMVPATDALIVDSSTQTLEEVVDSLAGHVASRAAAI
jgi:cytidylate kinase